MKKKKSSKKFSVGVNLAVDVIDYLGLLEAKLGCSRSFLVNTIVRQHAGGSLTGARSEAANDDSLARVIEM